MSHHLNSLPKLIRDLVEAGLEVSLTKDGYRVHGFNKIGSVTLMPNDHGSFTMRDDRYDGLQHDVETIDPLLYLYVDWWLRKPECGEPTGAWLEVLKHAGLVEVQAVQKVVLKPLR